ncbi:2-amino-3,7-dideoxy-D-threo-hept-6-ulosonate synthase [Lentzea sp. BCCO 10_0798]|jgi:2-amino-4,5-dihydroxy-6-oxo-7-(phosphonooxy)heptanoate synthase|uniref:2-amino-3,7-dideoxy-D-threo-hept-6-ulosonate synthase n=1 Tax=Lentzea kristufekii TaxID=3095430 RepID=A0ABU4TTB1_9PSEU|nr:2-amino-3,7-dideoxy-D-threo-hept-6-ulosonate synthase [Lentzea sp. BCCO 10_0798]MDX8051299.1 2-amino-3,7-dideoxy-D-threo-hept-6-ulosonate synthase [Lentzea sp. BCCO 10_0798]
MRKALRLRRLSRPHDDRYLFVPLDHSVSDGPVVPQDRWQDLIRAVVQGGADAIIVHKGRVRTIDPAVLGGCALIVHLSAGTAHMADANAKVLVGEVDEALRLGADAVSVHVNIGSDTEARQLADLGTVAAACDSWNVPLVAMAYARGPRIGDPRDPALLAHVVNIAADLGADIVKTNLADDMTEVVAGCPIPVIVAGGPASANSLAGHARVAMAAGCAGLAVGRRVFTSPTPMHLVAELASIVHAPTDASLIHALTATLENR